MSQITYGDIPSAEIKTYHRIDEHGAPFCMPGIDLIADIKREEGIETCQPTLKLSAQEDRDERSGVEIPLLRDADTGTQTDVLMHLFGDTGLEIKCCKAVAYLDGLKLKERSNGGGGDHSGQSQHDGHQ